MKVKKIMLLTSGLLLSNALFSAEQSSNVFPQWHAEPDNANTSSINTAVTNSTRKIPEFQTANKPVDKKVEASAPVLNEQKFTQFIEQVKRDAKLNGIGEDTINKAFANVTLLKRVIKSDKGQLEKKITLSDYLQRVVTPGKVTEAKRLYAVHAEKLKEVENKYQVPASYIVALWGMESHFGKLQGKEDIISAMATLAFEGRRRDFFTKELMDALTILDQGHVQKMVGSWAGAMGQCQFMPSSFLRYGADGDGDGKIDIWNNTSDVFASASNYLATVGWDRNQRWGREVKLPAKFNSKLAGLENEKVKTIREWQALGVNMQTKVSEKSLDQRGWIILPDDNIQRAFIVYSNFKTLMDWNRSYYFGISVGMMSDKIMGYQ